MDREVARAIGDRWRVESRTDALLILVRGRRPNHLLQLVLSILTLGLWLIGWYIVSAFAGEGQRVITFHPDGELTVTESSR